MNSNPEDTLRQAMRCCWLADDVTNVARKLAKNSLARDEDALKAARNTAAEMINAWVQATARNPENSELDRLAGQQIRQLQDKLNLENADSINRATEESIKTTGEAHRMIMTREAPLKEPALRRNRSAR